MDINVKSYPEKFCRTCLCESTNMKSLTTKIDGQSRTLLEVLSFVANLSIKTSDKLPKQVCSDCEVVMCKAEAFKRRCFESEAILDRHFYSENDGRFHLEIDQETEIKNEIPIEIDKMVVSNTSPTSISRLKPSNSSLFEIFPSPLEKNDQTKNNSETSLHSASEHSSNSLNEISSATHKENLVQIVKEEALNEYDDISMENETELFQAIPIECKHENPTKEPKVFPCICGTVFQKKDAYRSHLKTSHCKGIKIKFEKNNSSKRNSALKFKNVCKDCNIEFDTVKALKLHQRAHKNNGVDDENGQFECSMCMRKFSRKSSYTNHMKHHNEKSNVKYTCDTCKREFQHKAHLDNHILNVHTREKGFSCEICSTNFSTEESLEIHKDSHKIEKKHQCNLCKKAFYMLSTLNDHMRTHTGEKPFLCSICGKGFSQKTNLAQHMRRHQGLKPFKCSQCDRSFVSKGELVAHNRKHSGAHPFVCDDCGSGFTTSSSLRKHRRIHTGERPYACDLCSMRFAASGTLKNHRRTHTGEKPFQCSYCEKAFVQRHDLISHIRCHTGERPYVCECGQSFRKASALKTHVKLHGKETLQRDLSVLQGANMLLTSVHCVGNTLGQ